MSWRKTTIGEHSMVTSSKRFHAAERTTSGIPFYCSKELIQRVNGEEVTECDYIREDLYENVKRQFGAPETGDLLIISRGTAQKALPIATLKLIELSIPDIKTQGKIADILKAYDRIIENNQKQIKLLEETAQRLYKEWFVDLKFPNYEECKVIDGVPKGWRRCKVTDLLEIKYKALEEGNIPVYGSGGIMRKVKSALYSGESVLIPKKIGV